MDEKREKVQIPSSLYCIIVRGGDLMGKAEQNNVENEFAHFGEVCKNIANEMARRMIEGIKEYQKIRRGQCMKDCECGVKAEELCVFNCGTNKDKYEIRCPVCGESTFADTFKEAEKEWDNKERFVRINTTLKNKLTTMNTDTSVTGLTLKKCGTTVMGYFVFTASSSTSGSVVAATIPRGYRPPVTFATIEIYERGAAQIGTDGKITLYGTTKDHSYAVSFAYPISA